MPWFCASLRWISALLVIAFGIGAGVIAVDGMNDKIAVADVVVVPGNTVNPDGTLSPRLKARLDVALTLFKAKKCSLVLVSGATGKEGVDEAVAMSNYLLVMGVPEDQIIRDSAGVNTEATARNTAQALRQRKLKSVLATSQFFHVTRLRSLLEREGVEVVGHAHAQYFELRDVYSLAREVVAMLALPLRRDTA